MFLNGNWKTLYYGAQKLANITHLRDKNVWNPEKWELNELLDHSNCILVVRIDSSICSRNMKEIYFWVRNRVERS